MKFSKKQLDEYSNLCGLAIAIISVLVAQKWIPLRESETVIGLITALACYLTNKPARRHPTTEDLEEDVFKK